jgi:hypothetical protein
VGKLINPAWSKPNQQTRTELCTYSLTHGELTVRHWRELAEYLIAKYNDGYVNGRSVGYPDEWLRRVIKENPQQFRLNPIKP